MPAMETGIRHALRRLTARPDEAVRGLGHSGERIVARARLVLCGLALPLPLVAVSWGGVDPARTLVHLGAIVLANAVALLWLLLARRQRPWLAYASTAFDVTLVTGVLAALALGMQADPATVAAAWPLYLLVVASAALRVDGRLTLATGGLALGQYVLLEGAVAAFAMPADPMAASPAWPAAAIALRILVLVLVTATIVAVVRRTQAVVELSGHDALTGLPNRSWLLQRMPHVFAAARNSGASLTLVLLDIDRFRRVNDEAGPQTGDRALRHIADMLSAMLADGEALARIGGQEFVLVLHGPAGSAWERLDRLRRTLAEQPFLPERGPDAFAFTFSAGIAAWPHDGASTSSLLGCADRRMRSAKAVGGNRIVARDA